MSNIMLYSAMERIFLGDTYKIYMRETAVRGVVYVLYQN